MASTVECLSCGCAAQEVNSQGLLFHFSMAQGCHSVFCLLLRDAVRSDSRFTRFTSDFLSLKEKNDLISCPTALGRCMHAILLLPYMNNADNLGSGQSCL